MEGTEASKIFSGLLELDMLADHLHDVGSSADFFFLLLLLLIGCCHLLQTKVEVLEHQAGVGFGGEDCGMTNGKSAGECCAD